MRDSVYVPQCKGWNETRVWVGLEGIEDIVGIGSRVRWWGEPEKGGGRWVRAAGSAVGSAVRGKARTAKAIRIYTGRAERMPLWDVTCLKVQPPRDFPTMGPRPNLAVEALHIGDGPRFGCQLNRLYKLSLSAFGRRFRLSILIDHGQQSLFLHPTRLYASYYSMLVALAAFSSASLTFIFATSSSLASSACFSSCNANRRSASSFVLQRDQSPAHKQTTQGGTHNT